jgi:hypothetical protein
MWRLLSGAGSWLIIVWGRREDHGMAPAARILGALEDKAWFWDIPYQRHVNAMMHLTALNSALRIEFRAHTQ